MNFKKIIMPILATTAFSFAQTDALSGKGLFNETHSVTGWEKYINTLGYTSSARVGSIKMNINDDGEYVLEFWSNGIAEEDWDIQLKSTIKLEQGYSYTIRTGFYSYNENGVTGRSVSMGVIDSNYDTYFAESFTNSYGEYDEFTGSTYEHCTATDSKATFYINGGVSKGGFAVPWLVVDKEPINCGGTTSKSSSSTAIIPKSSSATQLNGDRIGPVSQYGQLQAGNNTSGKGRIYGSCPAWNQSSGNPVKVRGMSLFWSIDKNAVPFYTEETIDALVKDMKIEVIRIAMATGTDNWGGSSGYAEDPSTQENYIKIIVNAAIKNDIYVIIDWHSHTAHTETALAKSFFSKMAKLYGGYDNVIFEIYNEPAKTSATAISGGETGSLISWSTIRSYATTIISAIRQYSDNLIVVGTPSWSANVKAAVANPINDDNVAYTFHFYASSHTVSSEGSNVASAINSGLPVFVTEWGTCTYTGDGTINQSANTSWQSWLNQYDLSSANWSVGQKEESCSAFSTTSQGYGSLPGIGAYYTLSGSLVKGYIAKSVPTSYTACAGAIPKQSSSSATIIKSSSSTAIIKSSSSTVLPPVVISSSSSNASVGKYWESTNTKFVEPDEKTAILGDLTKENEKRTITRKVSLEKGTDYTFSITASTTSEEEDVITVKIENDNNMWCIDAFELSTKAETIKCDFTATSDEATISLKVKSPFGMVTLSDYSLIPENNDAIIAKIPSRFNVSVHQKDLQITSTLNENVRVQIFDIMGNTMMKTEKFITANSASISLETLPSGLYMIRIAGAHQVKTFKAKIQ